MKNHKANNLKILLVAPYGDEDGSPLNIKSPHFGLTIIKQSLMEKNKKLQVDLIDPNISTLDDLYKQVENSAYDIIAFSLLQTILKKNIEIMSACRILSPDSLFIIGGPDVEHYPHEDFFNAKIADIFILKDFQSFVEIADQLSQAKPLTDFIGNIPDLKYIDSGGNIKNTAQSPIIPPYKKKNYMISKVNKIDGKRIKHGVIGKRTLSVSVGNLCKGRCNFCSIKINTEFPPDIDELILEIKNNLDEIDSIVLEAADIFANRTFLYRLLDRLIQEKELTYPIKTTGRVDEIFDEELLRKMHRANIRIISYGVESFNDEILKNVNKDTTAAQNIETLNKTIRAGIIPGVNLILFTPWDTIATTLNTIENTISFLEKGAYTNIVPGLRVRVGTPLANQKSLIKYKNYKYNGMTQRVKIPHTTKILDMELEKVHEKYLKTFPHLYSQNKEYTNGSTPFYSLLIIKSILEAISEVEDFDKTLTYRIDKLIEEYKNSYE